MKILFVDGGNQARRNGESYNIDAAHEAAQVVRHLVGARRKALVIYDNSLDANRTALVICGYGDNSWQIMQLARTDPTDVWSNQFTMNRVNEIVSIASASDRVVIFVVSFADTHTHIRAMLNLFRILINSKVEMPKFSFNPCASFDVYEVDTTNHLMQKFVCK
jgi:hypothetical protein